MVLYTKEFMEMIFSTKAMIGKVLVAVSPFYLYVQAQVPNIGTWERLLNIGVSIFLLCVGIFVLWKELNKQREYSKDQNEKIVAMAERSAKATENSTRAIESMTDSMDRLSKKLDNREKS